MGKGTQNDTYTSPQTQTQKRATGLSPITLHVTKESKHTHTHTHTHIHTHTRAPIHQNNQSHRQKTNKQTYIHALGDLPDECWPHWDQWCAWVLSQASSCGQGPADRQHCGPTPTPHRHFPVPGCALVPRWCHQCSRLTALGFLVVWNGCETACQADQSDAL